MQCTVGIGMLGCGNVGASVAERLLHERDALERRSGVAYDVRAVAIRDELKPRPSSLRADLFTRDARAIVDDSRVDLVIECIGGITDAAELVERALERGRHVITANKDLIATQGPRLHALAASRGVSLRYEAAAGGAIPIVRVLDEALAGDRVQALAGVLNGTCTSILSAMEAGAEYEAALSEAQRLGFAEADPSSDVDGHDATHKLALLMQHAFSLAIISPRLRRSGIAQIAKRDIARAHMLGYRIRLVAAAVHHAYGISAEVAPVLVAADHPFARAKGAENVVHVLARDAGPLWLSGRGAGGFPTASAVLGDVVSTLRAIAQRHDAGRARSRLAPALDVAPFFADLPHHPELPRYPLWDDVHLESLTQAPVSHATRALS
jgi:homoserine dehydrogenase